MNFIAVINKYSRDIKYNKTNLYHYCEEHKKELEEYRDSLQTFQCIFVNIFLTIKFFSCLFIPIENNTMISIVVHITDVRHNLKNPCPSNSLTKYNPTRNGITAHNTHRTNTFLIKYLILK